jgi:hypothetical protein
VKPAALICTVAVLSFAPLPPLGPRPHDGAGATVGPARPWLVCSAPCPEGPLLTPPALPPMHPRMGHGGVHHGFVAPEPVAIPEPGGALLFACAVGALAVLRRRA